MLQRKLQYGPNVLKKYMASDQKLSRDVRLQLIQYFVCFLFQNKTNKCQFIVVQHFKFFMFV